jgi:hypothetical protein
MPERSTYRRVLAYKVYETEIERMVGEYNRNGKRGEICALDGKALLGMLKREDGTPEYTLSVYDVQEGKTIAQVEVGSKENEITKAPEAVKLAKIAGKVGTGEPCTHKNAWCGPFWMKMEGMSFRSRKTNSTCIKTSSHYLRLNIPSPALEKSQPIF